MDGEQRVRHRVLVCDECAQESDDRARGWLAFLAHGEEESEQVVVMCPVCAHKEQLTD
jgi:hypothetical protein